MLLSFLGSRRGFHTGSWLFPTQSRGTSRDRERVDHGACDGGWIGSCDRKKEGPLPHLAQKAAVVHVQVCTGGQDLRATLALDQLSLQPEHFMFIKSLSVLGFWDRQSSQNQRPMGARQVTDEAGLV